MIVIPSGRRSSEPVPVPSASGTAPSNAAIVVIMMGRKPKQARLVDGIQRSHAFLPLRFQSEIDHHDGVLLHSADQEHYADQGDHA
jgi:hypothetical protein